MNVNSHNCFKSQKSLETLDTNPDYINAMNKIEELQQGILDGISNQIIEPLQEFLPTVRNVQIHIQNERRRIAMRRNTEIIIDTYYSLHY